MANVREPNLPMQERNTRKPRFSMPADACDCHAHVFGPQSQFPYAENAAYIPHDASPEDYARMLRTIGCERGVLVQPSVYGTDNSAVVAALRSGVFPFRGVVVVEATITDRELQDLHDAGVRGVRINMASATPGLTIADAPKLAPRLKALGWHLQFFMNLPTLEKAEEKLGSLDIDIVIDHFGRVRAEDGLESPAFQTLLRLARRENVWAKLMGPYFVGSDEPLYPEVTPFAQALHAAAPERMVWGTDWPHPAVMGLGASMPNDGDLANMLLDWLPEERDRQAVLVDNPARLYGF